MGESKIVRRGGVGAAERTAVPTINFISKTAAQIVVTFKNNDTEEATIFYGLTTPPDDDSVVVAADATSGNITFSGLTPDTTFTIFAYALVTDPVSKKIKSEIVAIQETTDEDPFSIFNDTSGSPGSDYPINDLDGNIMADLDKGIAYYGTVSHNDLFTGEQLASEIGLTAGTSINNEEVWHKYYWNGGIHFWRKPARNNLSWNHIRDRGAIYGTGTTTSRKGHDGVGSVVQNAEVTKNAINYVVRLMEGSSIDPMDFTTGAVFNSEYNLILMNLHVATNSGSYSNSPTNGITYANWGSTNFSNNDFVGWVTNFGDADFTVEGNGSVKWQQERFFNNSLSRGNNNLAFTSQEPPAQTGIGAGWSPVITVKHPSFATYGKSGGFNQNQPDF